MKKIFIGMILAMLMLWGCYPNIGIVKVIGTMSHIDLEGGFWGIIADNGKYYDPINLPDVLKKEGLRVNFTLKVLKNRASVHMWGEMVEILNWEII